MANFFYLDQKGRKTQKRRINKLFSKKRKKIQLKYCHENVKISFTWMNVIKNQKGTTEVVPFWFFYIEGYFLLLNN